MGQHTKKQNNGEQSNENSATSCRDYNIHSPEVNNESGNIPIAEAFRCQIEVQQRLQENFEVQKKLQMRIEAQGNYLQSVLEKAQKSLTLCINSGNNVEVTIDQLNNLSYNNFEHLNEGPRNKNVIETEVLNAIHKEANRSLYSSEETIDVEVKKQLGTINFDLNMRESYDFMGPSGSAYRN